LEVVVLPFAKKFAMETDLRHLKAKLLGHTSDDDPKIQEIRSLIESTVIAILQKTVFVSFSAVKAEEDRAKLYAFAMNDVDMFVQCLLALNLRNVFEHPPVQAMLVALQKVPVYFES
jgi:hypothetical protein